MQFLFASGQVSVFGDTGICQQRIGASLHCYYFYEYSRSLLTLKAGTLFGLFILYFAFFREGAITLTGMLRPLWRCAALSGCGIAYVLVRCWNGMSLRSVSRLSWCVRAIIQQAILFFLFFFFFFFLGVTTMRVALVFCYFFLCVYYYLHIACFNALSLCRFLLFLSFSFY